MNLSCRGPGGQPRHPQAGGRARARDRATVAGAVALGALPQFPAAHHQKWERKETRNEAAATGRKEGALVSAFG